MDNKLLGEQIARYRKEKNLTQEELGKAVGVSTQAVSRWENGGAPDVALLPAIADRLGVTIDALFGRESGERVDIHETVSRWMASVPQKERFDQLCRLNWTALKSMAAGAGAFPEIGYLENAEERDEASGKSYFSSSQVWLEGGFMLDVHAQDMSFASVWPRPEKGYDAYFAPRDQYRRLFAVLARPGCLELLECLLSRSACRYYVPGTFAKILNRPIAETEAILNELHELNIIHEVELQLEDGISKAYSIYDGGTLVPFLYMARCMMQYGQNVINIGGGQQIPPLLNGDEWENGREKRDEEK